MCLLKIIIDNYFFCKMCFPKSNGKGTREKNVPLQVGYETVYMYLPRCKVADGPFHIQVHTNSQIM